MEVVQTSLEPLHTKIPLFIAEDDLAFKLGISTPRLAKMRKAGSGPPCIELRMPGNRIVIRYSEIEVLNWLDRKTSTVVEAA